MQNYQPFEEKSIYTLAQSGTSLFHTDPRAQLIVGNGTDIIGSPVMAKRAKRKVITRCMVLSLIDIAKEQGDWQRVQRYWNTYHCQNRIQVAEGRAYSKYCKNRICTVCNANRKADILNRYYPILREWSDIQFVTLTSKAQPARNLNKWMHGMVTAFVRIKDRCRKRNVRSRGIVLKGVRSLECNFNPVKKTYNPHFHVIVEGLEAAEWLRKEWLQIWTRKYANFHAQNITSINNLEASLIETVKYGSKIFTEQDLDKKSNGKIPRKIYVRALDNILSAMEGIRIFERFGFNLPRKEERLSCRYIVELEDWLFPSDCSDWINPQTGETLTGYSLTSQLEYLLTQCVDKELC